MRVGIDLDNTIIDYNSLVYDISIRNKLIKIGFAKDKKKIKESLLVNGKESEWRNIQSLIYGKEIFKAKLFSNFIDFILESRKKNYFLQIISHKTEVSNLTKKGPNLRKASMDWMNQNKFFSNLEFKPTDIHFESTRMEKIKKINSIGFDYFIDDLEEIFINKNWSKNIRPILFNKQMKEKNRSIILCDSWKKINKFFFEN